MGGKGKGNGKELCILYATCWQFALRYMLNLSAEFRERFEVKYADINPHVSRDGSEPLDIEVLKRCRLLIYQLMDWDNSVQRYYRLLPRDCRRIAVFHPTMNALWPFHCEDPRNGPERVYPYGDALILQMIDKGIAKNEIIDTYMTLDVDEMIGLDALFEKEREMHLEAEKYADIELRHHFDARFRGTRLFNTVNHGSNPMYVLIANQILEMLGIEAIDEAVCDSLTELLVPEMPIHPSVIRHFGLRYVTPESRYQVGGHRSLTLEEYLDHYIDYRNPNPPEN